MCTRKRWANAPTHLMDVASPAPALALMAMFVRVAVVGRKLRFIGNLGLYGNPASYKQKVKVEKMARADRSEFDHTEL